MLTKSARFNLAAVWRALARMKPTRLMNWFRSPAQPVHDWRLDVPPLSGEHWVRFRSVEDIPKHLIRGNWVTREWLNLYPTLDQLRMVQRLPQQIQPLPLSRALPVALKNLTERSPFGAFLTRYFPPGTRVPFELNPEFYHLWALPLNLATAAVGVPAALYAAYRSGWTAPLVDRMIGFLDPQWRQNQAPPQALGPAQPKPAQPKPAQPKPAQPFKPPGLPGLPDPDELEEPRPGESFDEFMERIITPPADPWRGPWDFQNKTEEALFWLYTQQRAPELVPFLNLPEADLPPDVRRELHDLKREFKLRPLLRRGIQFL